MSNHHLHPRPSREDLRSRDTLPTSSARQAPSSFHLLRGGDAITIRNRNLSQSRTLHCGTAHSFRFRSPLALATPKQPPFHQPRPCLTPGYLQRIVLHLHQPITRHRSKCRIGVANACLLRFCTYLGLIGVSGSLFVRVVVSCGLVKLLVHGWLRLKSDILHDTSHACPVLGA